MLELNLSGSTNKDKFVEEYDAICISRIVLLPGQKQQCHCDGRPITSVYYVFSCKKKNTDGERFQFFTGPSCGEQIIEKACMHRPPVVDFSPSTASTRVKTASSISEKEIKKLNLTQINKEAYIAISLIFMIWGKVKDGKLSSILEGIMLYPHRDIFFHKIEFINYVLKRTSETQYDGMDLNHIISFMTDGKSKKYSFPLMRKKLFENNFETKIFL